MNELTLNSTGMLSDSLLQSINQENYLKEVRAETFSILHLRIKYFEKWKSIIITSKQEKEYISKIKQKIDSMRLNSVFENWKNQYIAIKQLSELKERLKQMKCIKLWYQKYLDMYKNERNEIEIQLFRRKLTMQIHFDRWKYVRSLEKMSRRYTRDANLIFLRRAFNGWFNIIDKRKRLVRNYQSIVDNHRFFTIASFYDFWKDETKRQRKYRICSKKVNSILQASYFDTWRENYIQKVRLSKLFNKYQSSYTQNAVLTAFNHWHDRYMNRLRISAEIADFIQNSKLNLMKKYFYYMYDTHQDRVEDDRMVQQAANQLRISKLKSIFYRWADDAEALKKVTDQIRNVRKMMRKSTLNRTFSKWFSNYSTKRYDREKSHEYIEQSTKTLLKRSFTKWSSLFKSRIATKNSHNKAISFYSKLLMAKSMFVFKQHKHNHDILRRAALFRRAKLLLTIFEPWKQRLMKMKRFEFLVTSCFKFERIVSMKKGILAFKRYHLYLQKKKEEEKQAMEIFEKRKIEIFIRGFIEGYKDFPAIDLLKSESSDEILNEEENIDSLNTNHEPEKIIHNEEINEEEESFDEKIGNVPIRPDFLGKQPIINENVIPTPIIPIKPEFTKVQPQLSPILSKEENHENSPVVHEKITFSPNSKPKPIPFNAKPVESIEILAPRRPSFLPAPKNPPIYETSPPKIEEKIDMNQDKSSEDLLMTPPSTSVNTFNDKEEEKQDIVEIPPSYQPSAKRTRQEVIELVIAFSKRLNELNSKPATPETKKEASDIMNEIIHLKNELSTCL